MIGRLHGKLLEKQPPWLVIEVMGVGYELEAPMSTFYKLPDTGGELRLYTHLSVREDAHLLYGFFTENERTFFRTLLKVNGVGAKLALGILSGIEQNDFAQCVNEGNTARLVRLPGVGKKTAERLIVEMKDRLAEWDTGGVSTDDLGVPRSTRSVAVTSPQDDAISALVALGYKPQEASKWVKNIAEEGMSSEELIRKALQAAM